MRILMHFMHMTLSHYIAIFKILLDNLYNIEYQLKRNNSLVNIAVNVVQDII